VFNMVEIENMSEVEDHIMNELAIFIFKKSQAILVDDGKIDTAFLKNTAKIFKEGNARVVEYPAPYAKQVHDGASTVEVTPKELEGWVRRKLGITDPKKNRSVSVLISRKLKERGMVGNFFLDRAVDDARENFKGKSS